MSGKRAQALLEYLIILGIAIGALSAMQMYFQRGIKSAVRVVADEIGSQEAAAEVREQDQSVSTSTAMTRKRQSNTVRILGTQHSQQINYISEMPLEDGRPSYSTQITIEDR